MRRLALFVLAASLLGCATEPQVTPRTRPEYTRPLVTDSLPFLIERARVHAYMNANDWCQRRTWPHSEEFAICDGHPYLNRSTPPMVTIVRYDDSDRATAFAVFTPVPCRMYGACDSLTEFNNIIERDLVDHDSGLRADLVQVGEAADHRDEDLWSIQQRTVDALVVELQNRFGRPVWHDPHDYGTAWSTSTSNIGLFVVGSGAWVVETHELRRTGPPGLAALR